MPTSLPTRGVVVADRYELVRELGAGGIGTVWLATHAAVGRSVAVKLLHPKHSGGLAERFQLEARALGRLNHPNCITLHDFGFSEELGAHFLVMEYLEGRPLDARRGEQLPLREVLEIAKQVAVALAYSHHQGVLHRDLKPENVFLTRTFNDETLVKVLDFGLARLLDSPNERLTKSGEVFGTPYYMSPEQIRGTGGVGPGADLYSLGVMLYEMIEGRLPFEGATGMALMMGHLNDAPPPVRRSGVPHEVVAVVEKLLAKTPEDRYPSAIALWNTLDSIVVPDYDSDLKFQKIQVDQTWSYPPPSADQSTERRVAVEPPQVLDAPTEVLPNLGIGDDDRTRPRPRPARPRESSEPATGSKGLGIIALVGGVAIALGAIAWNAASPKGDEEQLGEQIVPAEPPTAPAERNAPVEPASNAAAALPPSGTATQPVQPEGPEPDVDDTAREEQQEQPTESARAERPVDKAIPRVKTKPTGPTKVVPTKPRIEENAREVANPTKRERGPAGDEAEPTSDRKTPGGTEEVMPKF